MYALGIILGEMTCEWSTSMERITIIRGLRAREIWCPLNPVRFQKELSIIQLLLSHNPADRPTADELSHMLPPVVHKSYVRDALKLLDEDISFRGTVLSNLLSRSPNLVEYTYDARVQEPDQNTSLISSDIISRLKAIFRKHGASERISSSRLLPYNESYKQKNNVVKLLDVHGNVVQLPYDFKVPFARDVARRKRATPKSFAIGPVYRTGDPVPRVLLEADFDIVSHSRQSAFGIETLRVAYEIVKEIPLFDSAIQISLGHSAITSAILYQANISSQDLPSVAAICNQLASTLR